GGREHALTWALAKSPKAERIFVAPGNAGTANIAQNVTDVDINDADSVLGFARDNEIGLVVIGPEAPLVEGVADVLRDAGLRVFGPNEKGAMLEGSKSFSKQFMKENGIPTASYEVFSDENSALAYVKVHGAPVVIKADGLAAGKGVVVAKTADEAIDAVKNSFEGAFGDAGKTVLVEERMSGPECSLLSFVSAGKSFPMEPAQDHKRAKDHDEGPNTGGMGAYSPVPVVSDEDLAAMKEIMAKAAAACAGSADELDYRGTLYGGFMLTEEGPKIVEFNVRFGDPEAQVVLVRLKSDLVELMSAVADGEPDGIDMQWADEYAVCVVLTSEGYPGHYEKGKVITGIDMAEQLPGVVVFHAGTALDADGNIITSGGRVLDVVGVGKTFAEARNRAYEACRLINFDGKEMRHDIGDQALAALRSK
ncbi:MAG: phosphoribosylamine--glycine ligase, partial [Eggerthellaceae bacterium]|nr:phosphoribosylamine--glycine ligase [Eggerthellaceae bacterium]